MSEIIERRFDKATWTVAELKVFSTKELNTLAFGVEGIRMSTNVQQFISRKGKGFTPANRMLAQAMLSEKDVNPPLSPARIETQVVPKGGSVIFEEKQVRVTDKNGQEQIAKASPVPTFDEAKRTSMDFIVVAITSTVEVDQGKVRALHGVAQWQGLFSSTASLINPNGLMNWVEVVTDVISRDTVFVSLLKPHAKTLAGYQFVNFIHDMILRLKRKDYMSLLWSFAYDLCNAFNINKRVLEKKEGLSYFQVRLKKYWKTTQDKKVEVPIFPSESWKFFDVSENEELRAFVAPKKTPLPYYIGGGAMTFTCVKAEGDLKSALKIATTMMQFRGGNETGLASFVSSLGWGNLTAPATRRQSFLIRMAQTIIMMKKVPAIHCTPGDYLAIVCSLPEPTIHTNVDAAPAHQLADVEEDEKPMQFYSKYIIVMSYEDQVKTVGLPKEFRRVPIVTYTKGTDVVNVFWENPDVKHSEVERDETAKKFLKKITDYGRYVGWTAVFSEKQFPKDTDIRFYGLEGRGAFDFGAIVTNEVHRIWNGETFVEHLGMRTFLPAKMQDWFFYVAKSNIKVSTFLLAPFYSKTIFTNAVKGIPAKNTLKVDVMDDGTWQAQNPTDEIFLGHDSEDDEAEQSDEGTDEDSEQEFEEGSEENENDQDQSQVTETRTRELTRAEKRQHQQETVARESPAEKPKSRKKKTKISDDPPMKDKDGDDIVATGADTV